MPWLVDRHYFFLLVADDTFLFDTSYEPFGSHLEIMGVDEFFIVSGCKQSSFITKIGDFCSTEAWSERGQSSSILIFGFSRINYNFFEMHVEDLPSTLQIRQVDFYHPIESPRSNQRSIK